jgi:hypothetical protein
VTPTTLQKLSTSKSAPRGKPIIWRFSGRLDLVSRVIVLGSQYRDNTKFGIIGIPRNSIFTPDANITAVTDLPWTTCTSKYYVCEASVYFNIPEADRMEVLGPTPQENTSPTSLSNLCKLLRCVSLMMGGLKPKTATASTCTRTALPTLMDLPAVDTSPSPPADNRLSGWPDL